MPEELYRRSFLKRFLSVLWGLAVLSGAYAAVTLTPRKRKRLWRLVRIPDPNSIGIGEYLWLEDAKAFVIRDEEGVYGLSARCTHLGCTVAKEGGRFVCHCHGAVYDEQGAKVSGPQPRDLPWLAVERQPGGHFALNLDKEQKKGVKLRI